MWTEGSGVIGVGYEGETIDSFVAKLTAWGVTVLADVRLNPLSRKPGFSKKRLTETLASVGIDYRHFPELGNARNNRAGYSERGTADGEAARSRFVKQLNSDDAVKSLDEIVRLASQAHVAVMCFEQSELQCHRQQVLKAVRDRFESLAVA